MPSWPFRAPAGRPSPTCARWSAACVSEAPTGPQPVLAQLDRLLVRGRRTRRPPPGHGRSPPVATGPRALGLPHRRASSQHVGEEPGRRGQGRGGVRSGRARVQGGGPERAREHARPALAAATERAQLHGGTVRSTTPRRAPRDPGPDPAGRQGGLRACAACGGTASGGPTPSSPRCSPRERPSHWPPRGNWATFPARRACSASAPWSPCAAGVPSPWQWRPASSSPFPTSPMTPRRSTPTPRSSPGGRPSSSTPTPWGRTRRFPCPCWASPPSWSASTSATAGGTPSPRCWRSGPTPPAWPWRRAAGPRPNSSSGRASSRRSARSSPSQSVRYERARIARELHDIVAHSVSLMVVQANAGERLATLDPESAAEASHLHQRGGPTGRGGDRSAGRTAQRHLARPAVHRAAHRRGTRRTGPDLGRGHLVPAAWRHR